MKKRMVLRAGTKGQRVTVNVTPGGRGRTPRLVRRLRPGAKISSRKVRNMELMKMRKRVVRRQGRFPKVGYMGTPMPNGEGFSAVGPAMQIGNVWSNKRVGPSAAAAEGLDRMSLGLTAAGRLAAAKALHPACDLGPQRWPDKAANDTLVMQNTEVFQINNNGGATDTWDGHLWLTTLIDCPLVSSSTDTNVSIDPNADMNAAVCGMKQQAGKNYAFWYSTQWSGANDKKHPDADFQTARITARSITVELNANATSNQGVVYACQFAPNMMSLPFKGSPAVGELTKLIDAMIELRLREKLGDDSSSEFESLVEQEEEKVKFDVTKFGAPEGNETAMRTVFQDWPVTSQQIMQVSPSSYMAKACQGVYLPLKHSSDILAYVPTANENYLSAGVAHETDSQTSMMNVLLGGGWNMGAILFEGLSKDATLSVKVITTLELTARSDSALDKFTEEAPPLDKLAQDHTRAAMGKLPDAFPAEDNVLGGIVKWIAGALEQSGIPIVKQVAGFANRIDKMTGGAATAYLDTIF